MTISHERELLTQTLGDEPPFSPGTVATQSILAGGKRRRRRHTVTAVGVIGLVMVMGGLGYSVWPRSGPSSTMSVADGTTGPASATPNVPGTSPAIDVVLKQLLQERGLQVGSRHGFAEGTGSSAPVQRVRGGFNTSDGGSVDIQITAGSSQCTHPGCKRLPDGRGYSVTTETVPDSPAHAVTTASVYEGDGRVVAVSMRNYSLTANGKAELGSAANAFPLDEQQLVDLAAASIWSQLSLD